MPIAIYGIANTFIYEKKLVWKDVYIKAGESINYSSYNDKKAFLTDLQSRIEKLYLEIENEVG